MISRSCASIGEVPLGLVHLGFDSGGVVMRFVEVAGVSTGLTAFLSTCASQCTASHSQACHYGCRDLAGGARLLSNSPGTYLLHPGIRFVRVVMRFVEVACVVIQGSPPSLAHVPLSAQSLTRRRVTPTPVTCRRSARLLPDSPETIYCTRESILAAWSFVSCK